MINTETSAAELDRNLLPDKENTHGDGDQDKQQQLEWDQQKAVAQLQNGFLAF